MVRQNKQISIFGIIYKMKNKKYHTVGTFPKSNRKILEMGKIDTLNTHILYIYIYMTAHFPGLINTDTSKKKRWQEREIIFMGQTSPLNSEIIR